MAAKKTTALTAEERLEKAIVPTDEQPYEVPENWCWTRLGNITEVIGGGTPSSSVTEYYENGTIPWLSPADLSGYNELYISCGAKNITELGLSKSSARMLPANSVCLSTRAPIGYVVIAQNPLCTNQGFKSFVPSPCYLPQYLYWYLRGNKAMLESYASGTTFLELSGSKAALVEFPLAPLAEQKRIVDTITELFADLDKAAENAQTIIDNAESRRSAILHQAFTGELTKQWRVENGLDMDSWEETPSSKLFEYVTSGSRGWAQYYSDNGAVFLRMGNLDHGTIELDMSDVQYVNLPEKAEGQRSRVKKGDILISITADVGMIGLIRDIDYEGYINQHVALARPVNTNMSEFIAWYLVSDVGFKQFRQKQRGATKVGLGLADIKSLYLKMPTIAEQREIVRILDELLADEQRIKEAAEETLAKIDLMKKSILADAFRGKLGTNDPSDQPATELLKQILA